MTRSEHLDDDAGGLGDADGLGDLGAPTVRHQSLAVLCDRLERILAGREASRLLGVLGCGPAGIAVLPSWTWAPARIDVGRKDKGPGGDRLLMPVRVVWSPGPVMLLDPGQEATATWSARGLGHRGQGTTVVTAAESTAPPPVPEADAGVQEAAAYPPASETAIMRADPQASLEALVADASTARWETLLDLEPQTRRALRQAHASVSEELSDSAGGAHRPLLDSTKLEAIADRMLFGDEDSPGSVPQIVERCLRPHAFDRVDPLRYITQSLRRDAGGEVRKAIGDPRVGPRVRRVARELGTDDVETVIADYRTRYPADRLSHKRAEAALSVAPDPMAAWWTLHPED